MFWNKLIPFILAFFLLGCHTIGKSLSSDKSNSKNRANLTKKSDTVHKSSEAFFFDTTISINQLIKEVVNYSKTVPKDVQPKPCGEYVLIAMAISRVAPGQYDSLLFKHSLCEDIVKFEELNKNYLKKVSEDSATYRCWHFTFTPVGEKYYIIEGELVINAIVKNTYYYQRLE